MNLLSGTLAVLCFSMSLNTIAQEVAYPNSFNEPIKLFISASL